MERIVEQGLLYDFYGELLTEHQRKVYEDVVYNDLSLAEIAEEYGISRQGVHDLVKRCNHSLKEYEEKLHLVRRFATVRDRVRSLQELAEDQNVTREELAERIGQLSHRILEDF